MMALSPKGSVEAKHTVPTTDSPARTGSHPGNGTAPMSNGNGVGNGVAENAEYRSGTVEEASTREETAGGDAHVTSLDDSTTKEFFCPICMEPFKEAFVTQCGHSFCYACIIEHLHHQQKCPSCGASLSKEHIYPNFSLNQILETTVRADACESSVEHLKHKILSNQLNVSEISTLLETLSDVKKKLEANEKEVEIEVLHDFLLRAKEKKMAHLDRLTYEINTLSSDISLVEQERTALQGDRKFGRKRSLEEAEGGSPTSDNLVNVTAKKRRVNTHFEDLQSCYFDSRRPGRGDRQSALKDFTEKLSRFTRYSRCSVVSTLKYGDIFNTSSIVSSIEFDRDDEYFATAGVTKKIKIFEFKSIRHNPVELHYPLREMSSRSKISCLSWNSYIKSQIASSDYEGIVTLWDVYKGESVAQFEEHDKRVWSVHFSRTDPMRLASGSDDTKVKIWQMNQESSVATVDSKANICCVRFNPELSNYIAFGSADHHVHYYDIRKVREPVTVFKGHRKAVSYVKFLNKDEFVSASTDSSLKLWSISRNECVRTFGGHANEKNFVGLATQSDDEFIACGSENNSVYVYYKALSQPILWHNFGSSNPMTGEESDDDQSQFVSSVCWKKNSNVLLAANSQGTIKVLELT